MGCTVRVLDDRVDVAIHGWVDRLLCLSRGATIPYSELRGAHEASWAEVRSGLGWRVGGGYLPGVFATGWFTIPRQPRHRQLLHVYRDRAHLLVLETTRRRPARIVVATPDAGRLAEEIEARRHAAPA